MIKLDDLIKKDVEDISMSLDNLREILQEATERVLQGSAEPVAVELSRATQSDNEYILSFSYNGFSFGSTRIHTER